MSKPIEPREGDYELMERAGVALYAALGAKDLERVVRLIQEWPDHTICRQIYCAMSVDDILPDVGE